MNAKPDHENETVSEREQSSIETETAPHLERLEGAADETRAADGIDEDVEPVEAAQD